MQRKGLLFTFYRARFTAATLIFHTAVCIPGPPRCSFPRHHPYLLLSGSPNMGHTVCRKLVCAHTSKAQRRRARGHIRAQSRRLRAAWLEGDRQKALQLMMIYDNEDGKDRLCYL